MSTLYIRLPARAAVEHGPNAAAIGCAYALASDSGSVEREGETALSQLAELVTAAQRVVLIVAAADVNLLRVAVPPLSPARLKAALPNLVEDQLISDPAESVVVAGRSVDGLRTVAVVQRDWLQMLADMLVALDARRITALPAQLCLPHHPDAVSAAVTATDGADFALTLRLSAEEGLGLPLIPEAGRTPVPEALQTLRLMAPQASITLYVPTAEVRAYQDAARELGDERVSVQPDRWAHWIAAAQSAEPDLLSGLGASAGPRFDWRPWRWPLALACAVLLVNVLALNFDWWHLRQDAKAARTALTRIYQEAYPNETVIVDPILQMRQKIAAARQESGEPAADDFLPLAAGFADAWNAAGSGRSLPPIAALEYHERALLVRVKPAGEVPLGPLKTALAARSLELTQQGADALQIRSTR
ncbi:MAG: type II secretion system protein GspL [Burkholderiaceae bacterium]